MQGKIIKGIAGFYYVHTVGGVYECKAKGIFRKDNTKPLVGDDVEMEVLSAEEMEGSITTILPRKNMLVRPAVANVDQALVIFSIVQPSPSLNLLDRFLIMMEQQNLPCLICFNKKDISTKEEMEHLQKTYEGCGYHVLFFSAEEAQREGTRREDASSSEGNSSQKAYLKLEELKSVLRGKTTTVAGPSGVGKSSIINCLQGEIQMETGEISRKIERGKHTTRHTQLIALEEDTYIMDTPGFSSLHLGEMEKEELQSYYPEFLHYEKECRFGGCAHIHEPVCGIKEAVSRGAISKTRYENYMLLYEELKDKKKY